ncbi:MAG TPA: alpha-galactosidase [Chitinophagaceae bacterium]|nr:alpha-galactosidase [Chitinophagaceae bacterium]
MLVRNIIMLLMLAPVILKAQHKHVQISNEVCAVLFPSSPVALWEYRLLNHSLTIPVQPPIFEIDGKNITANVSGFHVSKKDTLRNGVAVYTAAGRLTGDTSIHLTIIFHLPKSNPVLRFRYVLTSTSHHQFTKTNQADNLQYLSLSFAGNITAKEIRLSDFNEKYHAYTPVENDIDDRFFEDGQALMGPILSGTDKQNSFLIAYEHGSQFPNSFLHYQLKKNKQVLLKAVKGNYLNHQPLDETNNYETIWFDIAAVAGDEDMLAEAYRTYILKYITENSESRKPYIFYNTWGRQERVKWASGTYLSSMNLDTTLKEIEVAHQMGIEVYVLDMGWFQKSGDWEVNINLFPDTLKMVKALLDKYDMKLGLWFNPLVAAKSSKMLEQNKQNVVVWNGKADDPFPIWETEESVRLSLVSPYWKSFADKLISLVKQYGVNYFKLDGIAQYAANGTGHYYGTEENPMLERQESYAFQLPIYMSKIIDRVVEACPAVIFDFDITEEGRCMGLQFLSSGKYFIINNGPYYHSYGLAEEWKSPLANGNANIFVKPGPARGWFTRSVLAYDKWIPSVLFLTHYQPDEPRNSQLINIASLILGQNGIWGEILKTSSGGITLFHNILSKYKKVRNDITESSPVTCGEPGTSPEIHEKINVPNGKGAVVIFANAAGSYTYITQNKPSKINWHNDDVTIQYDKKGHAVINMHFQESSAKIIFFGVD